MFQEELFENGVVIDKKGDKIKIAVANSGHCDDCSAKLFCNPSEGGNLIELSYDGVIEKGDRVTLSIKGKSLVSLSFFLYMLPLILLVAGIIIGLNYFDKADTKELFSFITGITLVVIYYLFSYLFFRKKKRPSFLPKITNVI